MLAYQNKLIVEHTSELTCLMNSDRCQPPTPILLVLRIISNVMNYIYFFYFICKNFTLMGLLLTKFNLARNNNKDFKRAPSHWLMITFKDLPFLLGPPRHYLLPWRITQTLQVTLKDYPDAASYLGRITKTLLVTLMEQPFYLEPPRNYFLPWRVHPSLEDHPDAGAGGTRVNHNASVSLKNCNNNYLHKSIILWICIT